MPIAVRNPITICNNEKETILCKLLFEHGIFLTKKNNKLIAKNINLEKYLFESNRDLKDMKVTRKRDGKVAILTYNLAADFEDSVVCTT
jgi:hypothetical protein